MTRAWPALSRAVVAAALAVLLAGTAAAESGAGVTVGRLKYRGGGDWYANPTSLPNLLAALRGRTAIDVAERPVTVAPEDDELLLCPIVHVTGHGRVAFNDSEAAALRRYLDRGGFIWADDNYGMDRSFRAAIGRVLPGASFVELPFDHGIYHSFYDFPDGLPKVHEHDGGPPHGYGVFHEGRLVIFYSFNTDVGDGMEDAEVHHDPPETREAALRMGVNIVVYALSN
ncbi:MAG: DUF4159 domain-containing protein [Candidatus Eisenbacteria bacterium]